MDFCKRQALSPFWFGRSVAILISRTLKEEFKEVDRAKDSIHSVESISVLHKPSFFIENFVETFFIFIFGSVAFNMEIVNWKLRNSNNSNLILL